MLNCTFNIHLDIHYTPDNNYYYTYYVRASFPLVTNKLQNYSINDKHKIFGYYHFNDVFCNI